MTSQTFLHIPLRPEPSERFQPTGFPDVGAAVYRRPSADGPVDMLLVESTQSMANRLEAVGWNELANEPSGPLADLPWVRVMSKEGDYLTSSRTEAHRLASAFIRNSVLDGDKTLDVLKERFGLADDRPLDRRRLASTIFALDPLSLVHGVFFAVNSKSWPQQPKVARAVTAFVEAEDVIAVHSGGVKRDEVRHTIREGAGGSAEGYGMVPHHRTEYVAASVMLHAAIDDGLIRSYGLSEQATELLTLVPRWQLATLLGDALRFRTACTFVAEVEPASVVGQADELAARIRELAGQAPELAGNENRITDVVWDPKAKS